MSIKVIGGTPQGNKSLCVTCRFSHVMRGHNLQEQVLCRLNGVPTVVPFTVEKCNWYRDASTPSLEAMEEIAWVVKTRNRGPVGFAGGDSIVSFEPPEKKVYQQPAPNR